MSKLRMVLGLSRARQGLVLVAAMLLIGTRLALRWIALPDLHRTLSVLARWLPRASNCEDVSWAVDAVGRNLSCTCLVQSLVAHALMQRLDKETRLVIGVARDDVRAIAAHAWLEREGKVVLGGNCDRYQPLLVLGGDKP